MSAWKRENQQVTMRVNWHRSRPCVVGMAVRTVLLYVHSKETNVDAVNLFECEHCFDSVRITFRHLALVDESRLHPRLHLDCLVVRWKNANRHVTGSSIFSFQQQVYPIFQVSSKFRRRQTYVINAQPEWASLYLSLDNLNNTCFLKCKTQCCKFLKNGIF